MGPHDVTNVVHDNTSVLATIERQWNLPALTYRDASAATLVDFLDPSVMAFAEPPTSPPPPTPCPDWSRAIWVSRCRRRRHPRSRRGPDRPLAPAVGRERKVCDIGVREAPPWEHVERQKGRTKCALRT
jgi:hypothetical protein